MRGFSDEERERIREQLVETGRELLLTYGIEKTNVSDVTEPVGIAKSTFYRFFDSKAELYLEIFRRESEGWLERVDAELDETQDPREGLERFFWIYAEFAEGNPLVQQVIRGNYREMFRDVPQDTLEEVQQTGLAELVPYVESLQERSDGQLAELDPATILGIMSTIGLLALHREEYEEYGEGYYERVRDASIASLARGLTVEQ